MPRAIPVPVRHMLVTQIAAGHPIAAVAEAAGLSFWTVRTFWRRYRDGGAEALTPDYANCGRRGVQGSQLIARAACTLRRRHPGWGADLIRALLVDRYPDEPMPHVRTLRRWFAARGLTRPTPPPRPPAPPRAREPHQTWQVDAKEQVPLADGTRASWLSATDEATGAALPPVVFPPRLLESGGADGGAGGAAAGLRRVGAARPGARR